MTAADLIRSASDAGVMLLLNDDRLRWKADHQPSAELLAELSMHKLEVIEALGARNDSMRIHSWLWLLVLVDEVVQSTYTPAADREGVEHSALERFGGRFIRAVAVPTVERLLTIDEVQLVLDG